MDCWKKNIKRYNTYCLPMFWPLMRTLFWYRLILPFPSIFQQGKWLTSITVSLFPFRAFSISGIELRAPPSPPQPGRVAQSVGHLTRKSGVLGSIPGLATYFRFSFRFFKKGSCQLLAKVCARSTG